MGERAKTYRRYAEECLEMAARAEDQNVRSVLRLMAQAWHRLAQEKEASVTERG